MNLNTMTVQCKEITISFMRDRNLVPSQHNTDSMKNTQIELDLLQEFKKAGCYIIPTTNRTRNTFTL